MEVECKENEGVSKISNEDCFNKLMPSPEPQTWDKRLKLLSIDIEFFKQYLKDVKHSQDIYENVFYTKAEKCYFYVSYVNVNALKNFEEKGIDFNALELKRLDQCISLFVKKHWPDKFEKIHFNHIILKSDNIVHDEIDNIDRQPFILAFCLFDENNKVIEGDFAKTVVESLKEKLEVKVKRDSNE